MIKFKITWRPTRSFGMPLMSACTYLEAPALPRVGEHVRFEEQMMDPDERGPEKSGVVVSVQHYFHDNKPCYHVVIE